MKNIKQYTDHLRESSDQKELNNGLLDASQEGNLEQAKSLLDRGANVNAEDVYKWTPLHNAAWNGHTEVVKLLLDRGANVNAENDVKRLPLYKAARMGHTEVAKLLILNGADPFKEFDGLGDIIDFFKGDISWMPEVLKAKLERRVRSKAAFGRF